MRNPRSPPRPPAERGDFLVARDAHQRCRASPLGTDRRPGVATIDRPQNRPPGTDSDPRVRVAERKPPDLRPFRRAAHRPRLPVIGRPPHARSRSSGHPHRRAARFDRHQIDQPPSRRRQWGNRLPGDPPLEVRISSPPSPTSQPRPSGFNRIPCTRRPSMRTGCDPPSAFPATRAKAPVPEASAPSVGPTKSPRTRHPRERPANPRPCPPAVLGTVQPPSDQRVHFPPGVALFRREEFHASQRGKTRRGGWRLCPAPRRRRGIFRRSGRGRLPVRQHVRPRQTPVASGQQHSARAPRVRFGPPPRGEQHPIGERLHGAERRGRPRVARLPCLPAVFRCEDHTMLPHRPIAARPRLRHGVQSGVVPPTRGNRSGICGGRFVTQRLASTDRRANDEHGNIIKASQVERYRIVNLTRQRGMEMACCVAGRVVKRLFDDVRWRRGPRVRLNPSPPPSTSNLRPTFTVGEQVAEGRMRGASSDVSRYRGFHREIRIPAPTERSFNGRSSSVSNTPERPHRLREVDSARRPRAQSPSPSESPSRFRHLSARSIGSIRNTTLPS